MGRSYSIKSRSNSYENRKRKRDKERERERERDREREREREKERQREKEREKDKERERQRNRQREKEKERERKTHKYSPSRSRERSREKNREDSYENYLRLKHEEKKKKEKKKEKRKISYSRSRSNSLSKNKKRYRSKSYSKNSKRRKYSSSNSSRDNEENSIELRSRSPSRNRRSKKDEKKRKERREKKYDNEVDRLKEKEIEKHKEHEKRMNKGNNVEDKGNTSNSMNKNSIKENKELCNEEKQEILRKQRLAKARVFVLVEREEDKKNEEMLIENKGLIQDDFLEENDNPKDKFKMDDDFNFYEMENENEDQDINNNKGDDAINNKIDDNNKTNNSSGKKDINHIEKEKEEKNKKEEIEKINVTLGHRNMPHLPNGFFNISNNNNKPKSRKSSMSEIAIHDQEEKMNQINNNNNINININNNKNKNKNFFNKNSSSHEEEKKPKDKKPLAVEEEEEIDPLDAYMKDIEKDATMQDYQIYQEIYNEQLQKRYDDVVERDSRNDYKINENNYNNIYDNNNELDYQESKDEVKIIENDKEMEIDENKIITLEDILKLTAEKKDEKKESTELAIYNKGEEDLDKHFINTLKNTKVPDIDPLYGYSTQKNSVVLYQEDYNEFMEDNNSNDIEEAWLKLKKSATEKKELKLVNHALINYENFRKNLYVESKEVACLTTEKIENYRKENGDIKVRGKNIPNPIFNWYQCGLSDRILFKLEKKGFSKPFPIQSQSIPCIMSGRDIIGIAETGSGKTLAYVLPMLRHVMDQRGLKNGEGPISLIMAPTRELAFQIYSETKSFCKYLNLSVSCVYGGTGIGNQISELRKGAEIVICTPGRMIDVLCLSNGKVTNLQRVTFVVIDEADRMFDLGFEPQIARILANIRPDRQTVMFSATFPKQIESLAKKILNKPVEIVVGNRGQSCMNVQQFVEVRDDSTKLYRLLEILGEHMNESIGIIIFVDKQIEADELFKELYQLGYMSLVIHGGQDQEDRDFAIADFKSGVRNILISTSVCARGLDVKHCGLVINFRCPNHMEDYVHRVGRTGRAGNTGISYTFISPDEAHLAEDILRILEISNQEIPDELRSLVRSYKERLENGEVDKFRISGYVGRGFRFDENEKEKVKQNRNDLRKGYGMDDSDDEDGIEIKGNKKDENENNDEDKKKKTALALFRPKDEEKKKLISKDPKAKQIAIECGMNAAKNAIISGKSQEEAMKAAQESIEKALCEYKPSVSTEKGVEQAAKIIEEWVERENEKNNIFTCELDINDYPNVTRGKVLKKEFLENMAEMTQCTVNIRGTFVEPGKRVPLGQKKIHLYIQGNTKTDVAHAYREIKKILDESALVYYTKGATMGYAGKTGKYNI